MDVTRRKKECGFVCTLPVGMEFALSMVTAKMYLFLEPYARVKHQVPECSVLQIVNFDCKLVDGSEYCVL